tara:strand:- start:358 stop:543 length:186 start_codon:yes stop_codon:yes gene_type:complete
MLFKSVDGRLIKINKQDYNNDIDYYKQVLKIKGFIIKNKHCDFDKEILDILKTNFINRPLK